MRFELQVLHICGMFIISSSALGIISYPGDFRGSKLSRVLSPNLQELWYRELDDSDSHDEAPNS